MTPSLGTIIGLPVLLILIIAAAITGALFWRARRGDSDDLFWAGFAIAAWVTTACLIIGTAVGMNQRFVVTFTDGRQRACDDTRCSSVKPGDVLTLKCKRAYQWGATPGWDCNWLDNRKP